jgi:hypothetical protein
MSGAAADGDRAAREAEQLLGLPADADAEAWRERIDLDGLLVALVLVPHSYPRNRFFGLYKLPAARRVRRRAARLRSLVRELRDDACQVKLERVGDETRLRYVLPEVDSRRTAYLNEVELALVKLTLARAAAPGGSGDGSARRALDALEIAAEQRIAPLLARLF